ncbi:MAG: DUF2961 domain-containing protein [Chitinophagaceae bacterium]|nr:DUF2961 domain-containing protein [Chitinophagaceae bacterium]
MKTQLFLLFCLLSAGGGIEAQKLPLLPVGEDAYLQWDKWYIQRIGARTYMRSTYDRKGGNESADASHFLYMKEEDKNVTLDIAGNGVVYFIRTNHWHGSPWHYIVDGKDNIIQETGTSDPVHAKKRFTTTEFIPARPFPQPLAWTWSATKGADLVWTPLSFDSSFQLAYSRTHYGTGYYIYQLYANKEQLSRPLRTWDINRIPDRRVIDLLARSGTDIAPQHIKKISGSLLLDKESLVLAEVKAKASVIRALKLTLPLDKALSLERIQLKIYWDNAVQPSIDAPLCLFFGAGTLYNRDNREFLVKGFPINVRVDQAGGKVELGCYYPMPFSHAARVELSGITPGDAHIDYEIRYEPNKLPESYSAYFHATYQDIPHPEPGADMTLLDTRGVEGRQQWSGSFVGMSFIFSHNGALNTLEGDPRFFFDDSRTPQAYGTGTEEWGGGGDYWGGQNMTLPLAGHPLGAVSKKEAKDDKDLIESGYRFLLADLMPFGNRALIRLEHGGENLSTEHYEAVTYWYGSPAASLIRTDEIDVGDVSSEQAHAYRSPQASAVQTITSRYEWGIDTFPAKVWGMDVSKMPWYTEKMGKEVYPAQQEDGRYTKGSSEFTIALDPGNLGALLRRTLDYSFPNQRAEVYVSDVGANERWEHAGTWWLAGSNTCVFSGPEGELDKRSYNVQTSNRRLRDDEFLIPARLVRGKKSVRVRITFTPVDIELYPGQPFPRESAWSELKYEVYSYVAPSGVI